MSRVELVTPEGLRVDGRRAGELRRFYSKVGLLQADGSAYVEMGNTQVICAVYGPKETKQRQHDRVTINVAYHMASFSTGSQSKKLKKDRRLLEMASYIKHCFEPIVMTSLYPRSVIDIFIQVIQTDGGLLHTSINATCLALIDAGIPMTDYLIACSAGYVNQQAILDLNYIEESAEAPTLTVALTPKNQKCTMLNLECRLHVDFFGEVLEMAKDGCLLISQDIDATIRSIS
jgi:exosome complex component RRP41